MRGRVLEALLVCPNDVEAVKRLNSRLLVLTPGRRARFGRLNTGFAGGSRGFRSLVLASTFEGVDPEVVKEAVAAAPWTWPERTRLVLQGVGSWTVEELHQRV